MSQLLTRALYSEVEVNGRIVMLKIEFHPDGRFEAAVRLPREKGFVDFEDEGIPYPCKARWFNKTMDRILELCFFEVLRHFGEKSREVQI